MSLSKTHSRSLFRNSSYILVLLIILYGIVIAGRWMLANLAVREARTELNSWSLQNPPTLEIWQNIQSDLQRAISFKHNDADAYQLLGYLYEWQERITGDLIGRNDAVIAYRQSTEFRPGWPDDWVNLARMKAISGELDEEYSHALNRALVLGMNEARVEVELSYAISLGWHAIDLQSDTADLMDTFIKKSLLSGGRYLQKLNYLDSAGLLNAYCIQLNLVQNLISAPGVVKNRCESLGVSITDNETL